MKIESNFKSGSTSDSSNRVRTERAAKGGESNAAEVRLSTASTQLAGASSGAPIDGARIAEIKQAISEGRFKVNAEAIADGLIDTARNLLQSQGLYHCHLCNDGPGFALLILYESNVIIVHFFVGSGLLRGQGHVNPLAYQWWQVKAVLLKNSQCFLLYLTLQ